MIAILDVELCDCFLEYGEVTAEMTLLFTFVLFGCSLIWSGLTILNLKTAIFAIVVLLIRPVVFLPALALANLDWRSRFLIAWFGPRGLSSLLLVLVAVFARVPGSEQLFALCCLVVLLSVVVHGASLMFLGKQTTAEQTVKAATPVPASASPSVPAHADEAVTTTNAESKESIAIEGLRKLQQSNEPVYILDVRKERAYNGSDSKAAGAIRMLPEDVVKQATDHGLPKDAWLIAFCA